MRNKIIIALVFTFGVLGLSILTAPKVDIQSQPEQEITNTLPPIAETYTSYPDWTLEIPEIDFNEQMTPITKQGSTLPVPDGHPGYYIPNNSNIFIVGHNNSVFSRLSELPSRLNIWLNKEAQTYTLINSETALVENINI